MIRSVLARVSIARLLPAFSAILALLVGLDSQCFAQKTLTWKFTKGRVINVLVEQDTEMKLEGNPALSVNETKTTQTTNLTWVVQDVTIDGVAAVEQAIQRIVLRMNSRSGDFVIDTNDNTPLKGIGETIAKGIRPLAGARYTVKTKANGQVVDVAIPEEVLRKLKDVAGGIGEDGLREIAVNGSLEFPVKPVNVGDMWKTEFAMDMRVFGKLVMVTNYQYLGEEEVAGKKLDKIKATTAMRAADPADTSGLKLSRQESSGTIWFDSARGCIDHSVVKQEMVMDVNQSGKQVKQVVKQDLKLTFTSK